MKTSSLMLSRCWRLFPCVDLNGNFRAEAHPAGALVDVYAEAHY